MPQIAPLGPFDLSEWGSPNRVELRLDPVGNKDGLVTYAGGETETVIATNAVIRTPTVPALQTQYTVSMRRPTKTSRLSQVRLKMTIPVEAKDALGKPLGTRSHENSVDVVYIFNEKSTLAERRNLGNAMMALLGRDYTQEIIFEQKSLY